MTTGNFLYLLMVIGTFALFSAVLAYETRQQGRAVQQRARPASVAARTPAVTA